MTQALFGEENEMTAKDILCNDKGVVMYNESTRLSVRKIADRYQAFMYDNDDDDLMLNLEFSRDYAERLRDYLTKSLEMEATHE